MLVGKFLVLMLEIKAGWIVSKSEIKKRIDKKLNQTVNKIQETGISWRKHIFYFILLH